jgi:hypothetical protein
MSQADITHSTTPPEIPAGAIPRAVVERAVEALIVLLDVLDPDPDLESNGDDPSLGWTADGKGMGDGLDDRELDTADDELSLGWQNEGSQRGLRTSREDREDECDDEGVPNDELEPDYRRPPKNYMQPEDLGPGNSLGLELSEGGRRK